MINNKIVNIQIQQLGFLGSEVTLETYLMEAESKVHQGWTYLFLISLNIFQNLVRRYWHAKNLIANSKKLKWF